MMAAPAAMRELIRGFGLLVRKNLPLYVAMIGLLILVYRRLLREFDLLGEGGHVRRIRNKTVTLTDMENDVAQGIVDSSSLSETLSQVGGLNDAKRIVRDSVVIPLAQPHLYPAGSLRAPPKGLLLHGPPGTGKTLLARAIAKEANAAFIEVKLDTLLTKWVGDSEKHVAAVFSLARKLQPAIVFVDEIDGLLSSRDSHSTSSPTFNLIKTVFMTEWDGLTTSNHNIVVIGATNRPGTIDDAVLRRMPIKLKVDYPDQSAREQILRIVLSRDETILPQTIEDLELRKIASECDGYSGSDIYELCKEAALDAVRSGSLHQNSKASSYHLRLTYANFHKAFGVVDGNQRFVRTHTRSALEDLFAN
ncbi:Protein MSP1 [Diplonema papillatum]|nr:Protein MSP1 [Diplonema papillatum]